MEKSTSTVIYLVVGVLLTLIVVSAGIIIFNKAQPTLKKANEKQSIINSQIDTLDYTTYDEADVSGSEVISAINTKAADNISVVVKTLDNTTKTYTSASYKATAVTDSGYVEPTGIFKSKLNKTSNGTITGITFTQTK